MSAMTKEQRRVCKTTLLSELGQVLSRDGFSSYPRDQMFSKEFEEGRLVFHVSFVDHADDFDVSADVAVRFDAVERLVHLGDNTLSKREKTRTCTLGSELGNLSQGTPIRWTVSSLRDVDDVVNSICQSFTEIGLPYLEHYSQMENALKVLSEDDRPAWAHSPIHAARAKSAVALAVLLKKPDSELMALIKAKISALDRLNDPMRSDFEAFLEAAQLPVNG